MKETVKKETVLESTYSSTYATPMSFAEFLAEKCFLGKYIKADVEYALDDILEEWQEILIAYWRVIYIETEYENEYERYINYQTIFDMVDIEIISELAEHVYCNSIGSSYEMIYVYFIRAISTWETWLFEEWEERYLKSKEVK